MAAKKKAKKASAAKKSAPKTFPKATRTAAAANKRYVSKGFKGASRMGAGRSIAVENKRAGRAANPKAVTRATNQMSKKAPTFVRSGSRAPGVAARGTKASQKSNTKARMGREILRQNQAYTTSRGTTRTKGGQRRVEGKQAARVGDFRARLASYNKAFKQASAKGNALEARKATAGRRALLSEYKGWRKGGSKVNASG